MIPVLPPYSAPYIMPASAESNTPLIIYGRDVVYEGQSQTVIFALDNPFGISSKVKNHSGAYVLLMKEQDKDTPPKDCPVFDLKPENVDVSLKDLFNGHITLTTIHVTPQDAAPVLEKQCTLVKTQAVRTIIEREEAEMNPSQPGRYNP